MPQISELKIDITKLNLDGYIITTEVRLAKALNAWMEDYKEDKDSFGDYDSPDYTGNYGEDAAKELIKYLNKENN